MDNFLPQFDLSKYAKDIRNGKIKNLYDFKKYNIYSNYMFGDTFIEGLNNPVELRKILHYELKNEVDVIY